MWARGNLKTGDYHWNVSGRIKTQNISCVAARKYYYYFYKGLLFVPGSAVLVRSWLNKWAARWCAVWNIQYLIDLKKGFSPPLSISDLSLTVVVFTFLSFSSLAPPSYVFISYTSHIHVCLDSPSFKNSLLSPPMPPRAVQSSFLQIFGDRVDLPDCDISFRILRRWAASAAKHAFSAV